jgi:hypothetical protein
VHICLPQALLIPKPLNIRKRPRTRLGRLRIKLLA